MPGGGSRFRWRSTQSAGWSTVVVLPTIEVEFGVDRGGASIPYTGTLIGFAIGGWISGEIHDWTGSYQAAFLNGIAWNLLNLGIAVWLLMDRLGQRARAAA